MHTIQLLLIEADTAQDAFTTIASELSEHTPEWSDWHEADYTKIDHLNFAGRWSGGVFLTDEQKAQQEAGTLDTSTIPNHLCYADDPELADSVVSMFLGWRKSAIQEALPKDLLAFSNSLEVSVANYAPDKDTDFKFSMELWGLRKLITLLDNDWHYESSVYDLTLGTANLKHFYERCAKNPQNQFIVPVDFHH
jgi:hypothetical protein